MRTTFFLCCYFIITLISFSTSTQSNSNRWVHPGILVSPTQIKHISQLALNNSTCTTRQAYLKALDSKFANLSYISKGPPTDGIIDCGSYSHPDYGCSAESMDSATAYLHALLFAINGTQDYAHVAISILNKYANGVKNYTNSNAPLQAAWSGMMFTKAAELIRHSRNGTANWSLKNINAFSNMLFYAVQCFSMLFNAFQCLSFQCFSMRFRCVSIVLHAFQCFSSMLNALQCFSMLFQCFSMLFVYF